MTEVKISMTLVFDSNGMVASKKCSSTSVRWKAVLILLCNFHVCFGVVRLLVA